MESSEDEWEKQYAMKSRLFSSLISEKLRFLDVGTLLVNSHDPNSANIRRILSTVIQ